jgi:outer membrane protein assembly factor BamB
MCAIRVWLFCGCILWVAAFVQGADWPAFRGPQGNGRTAESGFPIEWSPEKNIKWRVPLPGPGNGSPIVVAGKVLVLCAEEEGRKRSTFCFDRITGKTLWKQTVDFPEIEETHRSNPHCSSTPASDGKRVFVWHRSAGMHCYDLDGNKIWSRDLGTFHHIWGEGPSPLLYGDLVIQLCGPGERTYVVALNKQTGQTVWQSADEPGGSSGEKGRLIGTWGTPVIVSVSGEDQILVAMHDRVVAYRPADGTELWSITGISGEKGNLLYASPVVGTDLAAVMGGFNGPAMGFKLGGSGDMTGQHRLWHLGDVTNPVRIGSGVVIDRVIYMANADSAGSIQCLDLETGAERWNARRTSDGPHWGSLVETHGILYVTGQHGITRVMKANPDEYELLAENDLGEQSNSTPALSNGEIFLRTWEALYCVSK